MTRRYSAYKDSGVEWIGEIPEHWECLAIRRSSKVKRGASPRPIDDPKYFDDAGVYSWVRISDLTASDRYLVETESKLSKLGASLSVKLNEGELFLSIAGSVGKPIITRIKCCIHDGFVYFENLNLDAEFLYYIFISGTCFNGLGKFGTQLNLNTDTIGSIKIPKPTLNEQSQIVEFLDAKTSLIDRLIDVRQRRIELLKEKRAALINNAVTKGLDPNVKMKDSGIEWIGEIPEHWEVKKLKYIASITYGISPSETTYNDEGVGTVLVNGPVEYSESDFGYTRSLKWTTEPVKFAAKGSLLFCLRGSTTGRMNITHMDLAIGRGVCAIISKHNQRFLMYSMIMVRMWIQNQISGSTFPSVTKDDVDNISICTPPSEEQNEIVSFLDQETKKIDDLVALEQKKIDLLKEYRQALISETVTGKKRINGVSSNDE